MWVRFSCVYLVCLLLCYVFVKCQMLQRCPSFLECDEVEGWIASQPQYHSGAAVLEMCSKCVRYPSEGMEVISSQ